MGLIAFAIIATFMVSAATLFILEMIDWDAFKAPNIVNKALVILILPIAVASAAFWWAFHMLTGQRYAADVIWEDTAIDLHFLWTVGN